MDLPVPVLIDNRIRLWKARLYEDEVEGLKRDFTHANPKAAKMRAMGYRYDHRKEPRVYKTWEEGPEWISFPRGGMARIKDALKDRSFSVKDERTLGEFDWSTADGWTWPKHRRTLWEDQERVVAACMAKQNMLVRSGTGCLAGSTMIGVNRAGISRPYSLSDLVVGFNGGRIPRHGSRLWDPTIATRVRVRGEDGFIRLHRVAAAYSSGQKQTFEVETERGKRLRATLGHRFLTKDGWKVLGELQVGDLIFVDGGPPAPGLDARKRGERPHYLVFGGLHSHPFVTRVRGRVPKHRVIAEARLNGIEVDEFLLRIRRGSIDGLRFIDPSEWTVHHRDEDPSNNDPENLEIVPRLEHWAQHGRDGGWKSVTARTVLERVIAIREWGIEDTFDLAMEGEPHNFLANGFVVHNSGKTTALIALCAKLKVPTLFVVWEGGLFRQWVERLQDELGLAKAWIGRIGSGTRVISPITVAMQQSIAKITDPKFFRLFGLFAFDEVQRASAATYFPSVDPFCAKYRIGASALEKRADRKEFLIYDLFGMPGIEVDHKELVGKGRVLPVAFKVVPTGWRPDVPEGEVAFWDAAGGEPPVDATDWVGVCGAMDKAAARTQLAVNAAAEYARAGHKVLVFSLRVDHCREMDQKLVSLGVRTGLLIGGAEFRPAYEETKAGLKSGRLQVGVGTVQAVGQGLDFPEVDRGVVAMPIAENRSMLGQVKGRICRMREGKDAEVTYLWDEKVWPTHLAKVAKVSDGCVVKVGDSWVPAKEWRKAVRGMMGKGG